MRNQSITRTTDAVVIKPEFFKKKKRVRSGWAPRGGRQPLGEPQWGARAERRVRGGSGGGGRGGGGGRRGGGGDGQPSFVMHDRDDGSEHKASSRYDSDDTSGGRHSTHSHSHSDTRGDDDGDGGDGGDSDGGDGGDGGDDYKCGDRVKAQLSGFDKYEEGVITKVNGDGTFDMLFEDMGEYGEERMDVRADELSPTMGQAEGAEDPSLDSRW